MSKALPILPTNWEVIGRLLEEICAFPHATGWSLCVEEATNESIASRSPRRDMKLEKPREIGAAIVTYH